MSLQFDGINSYATPQSALVSSIPFGFAYTFSCWFKTPTIGAATTRELIGFHSPFSLASNRYTIRICLNTSNQLFAQSGSDTTAANSTTTSTIAANQWHHAAGAFSLTFRQAWLNGVASTASTTSISPGVAGSFFVGAAVYDLNSVIAQAFDGLIGHVAFWNQILSNGEIVSLASGAIPTTVRQNSLMAYYPLIKPPRFVDGYVIDIKNEGFNPLHGESGDRSGRLAGSNSIFPSPENPPLTFSTPVIQNNKRIFLPTPTNRLRSQIAFLKPYTGILPVANG